MINYITYLFLISFSKFLAIAPRKIVLILGKGFGKMLYFLFPLRLKVAKINLQIAFPNKNNKEIHSLILKTYMHYGLLMFEFIRFYSRTLNNSIINMDSNTLDILSSKDGFILMTGHLGNWEMMIPIISQYKKMTVIVREHKNVGGDKFFSQCRNLKNVTLISNKGSKRKMINALTNGEILALASDQNAKHHGTYNNFFGKKASIPKGAGHFYNITNKKIIIGFCILNNQYKYNFKLERLKIDKNDEQKENLIVKLNDIYAKLLENEIKKFPEQYFWFHKKWEKNIY